VTVITVIIERSGTAHITAPSFRTHQWCMSAFSGYECWKGSSSRSLIEHWCWCCAIPSAVHAHHWHPVSTKTSVLYHR